MSINWTHIYREYKGLWVALKDDEVTVISSGKTLEDTSNKAKDKGFENPIFFKVPQKLNYFVGATIQKYKIKVRFPYRKIDLKNPFNSKQFILRPIIPLSIKHQGRAVRFEALIDSGADFNIFPVEIAEKLGIILKGLPSIAFAGVGGSIINGVISSIIFEVGSKTISTKVVFAPVETGILGQYGFFDLCQVDFDIKKKIVDIRL